MRLVCVCAVSFLFLSCVNRTRYEVIVDEWIGKKIVYPSTLLFTDCKGDTVDYLFDGKVKIVTYVDSVGCTPCSLKFNEWIVFMNDVKRLTKHDIPLLYAVLPRERGEIVQHCKSGSFCHPLFIDMTDSLNLLNNFPKETVLRTFLVDEKDNVILVGSPLLNEKIKEMYIERIRLVFNE